MARAFVDKELENSFAMIERRDFILWGLATAATMMMPSICEDYGAWGSSAASITGTDPT